MADRSPADFLDTLFLSHAANDPVDGHRLLDEAIGPLADYCPLGDEGVPTGEESLQALGDLDTFPVEVQQIIVASLDIATLQSFRRVSRSALALVNNLAQYGQIRARAPSIIRAALAVKATSFDFLTLRRELNQTRCVSCGCFGSLLYIITGHRVCYFCFGTRPEYRSLSGDELVKNSGVLLSKLEKFPPSIRPLPGQYGPVPFRHIDIDILVDNTAVRKSPLCGKQPWTDHLDETQLSNGDALNAEDLSEFREHRYMAVLKAPFFGPQPDDEKKGWFCRACVRIEEHNHWRIQRTKDELTAHIYEEHGGTDGDLKRVLDGPWTKSNTSTPFTFSPVLVAADNNDEAMEENLGFAPI